MANNIDPDLVAAGQWAKRYWMASRAVMEEALRPYDLGTVQWYVLHLLSTDGPTGQRELTRALEVERATLSGVVAALVRKGLAEQCPDLEDQRRKVLQLTPAGAELVATIPNPVRLITEVAFEGVDAADRETVDRVLREATQRLTDYKREKLP